MATHATGDGRIELTELTADDDGTRQCPFCERYYHRARIFDHYGQCEAVETGVSPDG